MFFLNYCTCLFCYFVLPVWRIKMYLKVCRRRYSVQSWRPHAERARTRSGSRNEHYLSSVCAVGRQLSLTIASVVWPVISRPDAGQGDGVIYRAQTYVYCSRHTSVSCISHPMFNFCPGYNGKLLCYYSSRAVCNYIYQSGGPVCVFAYFGDRDF